MVRLPHDKECTIVVRQPAKQRHLLRPPRADNLLDFAVKCDTIDLVL
eukprot:COSAG05_NODE_953_length_6443_cov_14.987390_9_plen_47_part_00